MPPPSSATLDLDSDDHAFTTLCNPCLRRLCPHPAFTPPSTSTVFDDPVLDDPLSPHPHQLPSTPTASIDSAFDVNRASSTPMATTSFLLATFSSQHPWPSSPATTSSPMTTFSDDPDTHHLRPPPPPLHPLQTFHPHLHLSPPPTLFHPNFHLHL